MSMKKWLARADARGSPALASSFVFFEANYGWTGFPTQFTTQAPYSYSLIGQNPTLDFDLKANIRKEGEQQLSWDVTLDAHSAKPNVIGGGFVFNFDPALFQGDMGKPKLLDGNKGWAWGNAQGRRIEMRFEPALADVFVEPGDGSEVRAFFYKNSIKPGQQHFKATLSISGDVALAPTTSERFGLVDPKTWPTDKIDWQTSPVDLSFLNANEKPAGKRGFVKASGEQLMFADNTPARFWGTNMSAYSLYDTAEEDIKRQARRLSALGINLVRLHHHDSPGSARTSSARRPTRTPNNPVRRR